MTDCEKCAYWLDTWIPPYYSPFGNSYTDLGHVEKRCTYPPCQCKEAKK